MIPNRFSATFDGTIAGFTTTQLRYATPVQRFYREPLHIGDHIRAKSRSDVGADSALDEGRGRAAYNRALVISILGASSGLAG